MNNTLEALKTNLERFGEENDHATTERSRRMLNITRDTGEFLSLLVRATAARSILEIGTSNGYSTLWLAQAAKATGGVVTTVEYAEYKFKLALENFSASGLSGAIQPVLDDAGRFLQSLHDASQDFIFLDSERIEYIGWWPDLKRVLRPGGLIVVDNALSHEEEMAPFVALVRSDHDFETSLVPVGKGEFLAVKASSVERV
ncbi:O-methyltransferase [Azotobacter salinestris]|uniref:O-methyltransferase n=1 Tax=Azotobacter salinestris TaxID=69964 RepID=UPI0032DEA340